MSDYNQPEAQSSAPPPVRIAVALSPASRPPRPGLKLIVACIVMVLMSGVLGMVGIAVLAFAIPQVRMDEQFPRPVTMTHAEFVKKKPKEGWFRVTGGELCLEEATYDEYFTIIERMYVPLHAQGGDHEEPVQVLYHSEDEDFEATLRKLAEAREAGEEAVEKFYEENPEGTTIVREIEGTVTAPPQTILSDGYQAYKAQDSLAPDCIILTPRTTIPALHRGLYVAGIATTAISAALLIAGVLLGVLGWRRNRAARSKAAG